ncbi:SUMO-activating enzyme subunit 2 [Caerostris extrusa]|uniref:SUMO-activating enzyme subunit 2 n=1 Tax=Caerostris extrusa TaxID=172846 RepID=A0AAV4PV72_CAEEX|nr:SUMO-activating enzyme subunit 2 [Caerostris extrusa]
MKDLWKKRSAPRALNFKQLPDAVPGSSRQAEPRIKDQVVWSVKQCADIFCSSLAVLKKKIEDGGSETILTWDKDDEECLDFVSSVSNLRAYCFYIPLQNRFQIKAIAGNIVPAIATTNAIISGLLVLQLIKVLNGDLTKCRTTWLNESARGGKIISSAQLEKPSPKCFVQVKVNFQTIIMRTLDEKILKEKLHMIQPDVVINDNSDDFTNSILDTPMSNFAITNGSSLLCEDFFQQYKVSIVLQQSDELKDQEFEIETDLEDILSAPKDIVEEPLVLGDNFFNAVSVSDDEDIQISEERRGRLNPTKKRLEDGNAVLPPAKKARTSAE